MIKVFVAALAVAPVFIFTVAHAQTGSLAYEVANMRQDMGYLNERVQSIRVEMDDLRRENSQLRLALNASEGVVEKQLGQLATVAQINAAVARAVSQLEARDISMRTETLAEVSKQIQALVSDIEKMIGNIGAPPKPDPGVVTEFSDDWPKTGTTYTVKGGDTLSRIATAHNSTVPWIQHANKIVSDRLIQPGQTLFIPQRNE